MDLIGKTVEAESFSQKLTEFKEKAEEISNLLHDLSEKVKRVESPPLRVKYDKLMNGLIIQMLRENKDERDLFINEYFLNIISELLFNKIEARSGMPGQAWDEGITINASKILSLAPTSQRNRNPDFLKCVTNLEPFHPLRAGAGTWFTIHILASKVKNIDDHNRVCEQIYQLQDHFYCPVCREHFGEYLKKNDPRLLIQPPHGQGVLREVISGDRKFTVTKLFEWTVDFHNSVNKHRINFHQSKTPAFVSLVEAYDMYYNKMITPCSACMK